LAGSSPTAGGRAITATFMPGTITSGREECGEGGRGSTGSCRSSPEAFGPGGSRHGAFPLMHTGLKRLRSSGNTRSVAAAGSARRWIARRSTVGGPFVPIPC
ncbi:MAG: hypothetical protein AAF488_07630, partial [Planctomycetota bacterium]